MEHFKALGFRWDRDVGQDVSTHPVERACFRFHKMLSEFVWDASVLEGNPFTYPEVQTLLDGVTVGGRKISDQDQVLNLAASSKRLIALVKERKFTLGKEVACELHGILARGEALEWGHFRGEGPETNYTPAVGLGEHGRYYPLPTERGAIALNLRFSEGVAALADINGDYERGRAYFLFGALQQFFFDGNKRTSRFMMNGVLMSAGIDAISVPARRVGEFNESMIRFFLSKDGTEMMSFLHSCHPDTQPAPKADGVQAGAILEPGANGASASKPPRHR